MRQHLEQHLGKAVDSVGTKTISFPKGKGHLTHNNRDFISQNVVPERTSWNRIYIQEPLEAAYEKCFGEALRNYNAAQKRKYRIKEDYLYEIRHSKNGEKDFYENVVQIGTMENTPVVDENGKLTEDAEAAIRVLEQYAKIFQERNPNLYLFNCVMHLDEKTPHLHMDYIPVAHGYKTGLETRNSLTKAFQQMGFAKAISKKQNETVAWQERERAYLTKLCMEQGIEIEMLGIKRDNLSLPEYKEAMRKVESLEAEAEKLDLQNGTLEQENETLAKQMEELAGQIEEMEQEKNKTQKLIDKHELTAKTLKIISKEVEAETGKMKSAAVPINTLFGGEEYVKVKKSDWSRLTDAFSRALSVKNLVDQYEKKITNLNDKLADLEGQVEKLKRFVAVKGLGEAFVEFVKSLEPKTFHDRLKEKKEQAVEHNRKNQEKRKELPAKKRLQQEI